jgi:hypothetical protein
MAAFASVIRTRWAHLTRAELYALLVQFSNASAALSVQNYTSERLAAGIRSRFTVSAAPPASPEQFANTLNWVYGGGTASIEQRLAASMTRLAAQTGRETTIQAVKTDRQARAWARETRGDCCYFCAMLASRGAVYRSEATAKFEAHDGCHCIAVPVFGAYEKTADARAFTRQWHDLRRDLGHSPSLLQWRRHFEGRDVQTGKSPSASSDQPAVSGS